MNIFCISFLCDQSVFIFSGENLKSRMVGSLGRFLFSLIRKCQGFVPKWLYYFSLPFAKYECSVASHPRQHSEFSLYLIVAVLADV